MTSNLKQSIIKFITEARTIDGAEDAIFEVSKEYEKCLILTGEIYGKETNHKINELGRNSLNPEVCQGKSISCWMSMFDGSEERNIFNASFMVTPV